jgi:uncharacterized membrane protein (UPF0127 family)
MDSALTRFCHPRHKAADDRWGVTARFALFLVIAFAAPSHAAELETVTVVTAKGTTEFQAEIADSAEERQQGLMFRPHLPADRAMLFDFGAPRQVAMWMKDTRIPLDIIFIAADGQVEGVRTGKPFSEDILSVEAPARAVLEVAGGTAKRIGLAKGDRVRHRIFEAKP